jgi:hypothetical protein
MLSYNIGIENMEAWLTGVDVALGSIPAFVFAISSAIFRASSWAAAKAEDVEVLFNTYCW